MRDQNGYHASGQDGDEGRDPDGYRHDEHLAPYGGEAEGPGEEPPESPPPHGVAGGEVVPGWFEYGPGASRPSGESDVEPREREPQHGPEHAAASHDAAEPAQDPAVIQDPEHAQSPAHEQDPARTQESSPAREEERYEQQRAHARRKPAHYSEAGASSRAYPGPRYAREGWYEQQQGYDPARVTASGGPDAGHGASGEPPGGGYGRPAFRKLHLFWVLALLAVAVVLVFGLLV